MQAQVTTLQICFVLETGSVEQRWPPNLFCYYGFAAFRLEGAVAIWGVFAANIPEYTKYVDNGPKLQHSCYTAQNVRHTSAGTSGVPATATRAHSSVCPRTLRPRRVSSTPHGVIGCHAVRIRSR